MKSNIRRVVIPGVVFVFLSVALALPRDEENGSKNVRSPAVDDDNFPGYEEEQPTEFSLGNFITGRVGNFLTSFLQLPGIMYRFVSGLLANQPFAKLREEVRNLNISYPKN